jgi:hypothetical protein
MHTNNEIDAMLNHLKEVFIAERIEEGEDEQLIRETVEKMLKPGNCVLERCEEGNQSNHLQTVFGEQWCA